jgi:prepilin peptidase CpaA
MSTIVVIWILPMLLVAAAITDLTSFTIPNVLPGAMLALFVVFVLAMAIGGHPIPWHSLALHIAAGTAALIFGMVLFAVGGVGGGDAKLFAITCLWLGWNSLLQYTALAMALGGALTLAILLLRRMPLPPVLASRPWIVRLADGKAGVPYGIALAIAAIGILPETELFRLAATI